MTEDIWKVLDFSCGIEYDRKDFQLCGCNPMAQLERFVRGAGT